MKDINSTDPTALLALLSLKGLGPKKVLSLTSKFGSTEEILSSSLLRNYVNSTGDDQAQGVSRISWESAVSSAERVMEKSSQLMIKVISYSSSEYPSLLKNIPDFPPVLFIKGDLRNQQKKIACVGTREPTFFGRETASRLTSLFISDGWSIVSGLAIGIDSIAHFTAVQFSAHTVAVLANGLDSIYPKSNQYLAEIILDKGGALISETKPGTEVLPRNLVSRDRIQSGLSFAVVVMQTDLKGGTMHTVRYAVSQGRPVYAPVPPEIYADENKNQGLIALTTKEGDRSIEVLKGDAHVRQWVFQNPFHTVARPITGKSDYKSVLMELNELVKPNTERNRKSADYQNSLL